MFFRRKKADGFDWHQYVRTTIKLRRDQRRAKLDDIGRVAASKAKAASDAAVNGVVEAAGSGRRATVAAWRSTIAQPAVALPFALCGGVALLSGGYRWLTIAPDAQALVPLILGLCVLLLIAPLALQHAGALRRVSLGAVPLPRNALPVVGISVLALALGWYAWGGAMPRLMGQEGTRSNASPGSGESVLEGRVTVLSGEMIRLQGRLLHLSGIEAPDRQQTCTRNTKQPWRCGEAAFAALEKLARAKAWRCVTQGGPDVLGRSEANCTLDGRDVAGELVKDGHVFSAATYFGGYAAMESEARHSGNGLWSGEAERPTDFRSRTWLAAKAQAPDGCPIKGRISEGRKTYLMPWAAGYAQANLRASRGERWFCDEAEAVNAGFKLSGTPIKRGSRQ